MGAGQIETLENIEGGALRALAVAGKGAHSEQFHLRRNAKKFCMRSDGAGHAGTVRMRRCRRAKHVIFVREDAGKIGMPGVDLRIEHRDQDIVATADAVRLQ